MSWHLLVVGFECVAFSVCSCGLPGGFSTPARKGKPPPGVFGPRSLGRTRLGAGPWVGGVGKWPGHPERGRGDGVLLSGETRTLSSHPQMAFPLGVQGDLLPHWKCWACTAGMYSSMTCSKTFFILSSEICFGKQRDISCAPVLVERLLVCYTLTR